MKKPILYLKASYVDSRVTMAPNCEYSRSLFDLMGRGVIETMELPKFYSVGNHLGFEVKIDGDIRHIVGFLKSKNIPYINNNMTQVVL